LGKQLGGGSFYKKFEDFPNSDGDFKLRIVEFVDSDTPGDDDNPK